VSDLTDKRDRLRSELTNLTNQYRETRDQGVLERMSNVKTGIRNTERQIVAEAAENPANVEDGTAVRTVSVTDRGGIGLRAIERMTYLEAGAADRLETLVRSDKLGTEGRYIDAVSDPDYDSAFGKRMLNPDGAQHEYSAKEAAAVRKVAEVASERAMAEGTGPTGQFAIPASLDPSINLVSDGRVNPIRALASQTTIATDRWQGVNSQGVVAHWYAEAEEVSDDSPTLSQPEIHPERMSIFVPFSIEVGQDWPSMSQELGVLFADAKDELEAKAFTLGDGSGEPQGLLIGGTITVSGGTATQVQNYYSLQEALPPRYQPRAVFLSSNAQENRAYRSVASADTDEPPLVSSDRRSILGKPWQEVSHMTTTTAGTAVVYGDVRSAYRVVDRIGATTELVPHLFGSSKRPTGQRGLFFYARVGAEVTNANAIRKLVVT
jgi:HK97 family phage major capsid protein